MLGIGSYLSIWTGKIAPTPSPLIADLFEEVTITAVEDGVSAFEMKVRAGRSGPIDIFGYRPQVFGSVDPGLRITFTTLIRGFPRILFDGFVTQWELLAAERPGEGMIVVKGEEPSFFLDRKSKSETYPGHTESMIANRIIAQYARYGMTPTVIPSLNESRSGINGGFEVQAKETDFMFLKRLAQRLGYVFWVESGPLPGQSIAYFGPPKVNGFPQPAISANMGPATNATNVKVREDPSAVSTVDSVIADRKTGRKIRVKPFGGRVGSLALSPALLANRDMIQTKQLCGSESNDYSRAAALARGIQNKSADGAVVATGMLDNTRFGSVLQARDIVGLRGDGIRNAGLFRVRKVKHIIRKGSYKQDFELARDGNFTTLPGLRVV